MALSGGKYTRVHHFEYKSKIAEYGRLQAQAHPTFKFQTVEAGFYATNILPSAGGLVTRDDDGEWSFSSLEPVAEPGAIPVPMVDINADYRVWVRAVIEHKELQDDARPVLTCGEEISLHDLLNGLEKKAGITINRTLVSQEAMTEKLEAASTPQHIIDDFEDMWSFLQNLGYYGGQDIHWADKHLARKPKTWAEWLETADLSDFFLIDFDSSRAAEAFAIEAVC
ncbi:hypothetical protein BCR35DRAFT_334451 [Leucosporidium creatinivorum]|uniref:NmrA-like domain-containing protein n=1 Tax=Leucosporidium creatinivorum TaxID=106004 RepID=A0A1Y2E935_9BASI|nr:hypothetical protein BCR35DRAFT_334451 [Leucosporidium creatinivorum]